MKCPCCDHKNHLEIDLHADGFSTNLIECSVCGALLMTNHKKQEIIREPAQTFTSHLACAQ